MPRESSAWQPTASLSALQKRSRIIAKIRAFFAERHILEVETPLLCRHSVTDPHIESFCVALGKETYYLQTSPEYAMKRLLASDSGAIYQICKAFRQEEQGQAHNSEFTLLEWYRPGFDHHQLMQEVDALLQTILHTQPAEKATYQSLFEKHLQIDPLKTNQEQLINCAQQNKLSLNDIRELNKDDWLQLLFNHFIENKIGQQNPTLVYDYPASQSALAKISQQNPLVAERFEVFYKGMELANGYHELTDATEQKIRFLQNQKMREQLKRQPMPIDPYLIEALVAGLPDCAGVALGIDRLILLASGEQHIKDVISFTQDCA